MKGLRTLKKQHLEIKTKYLKHPTAYQRPLKIHKKEKETKSKGLQTNENQTSQRNQPETKRAGEKGQMKAK